MAWGNALSLAVSVVGFVALFWRFSTYYGRIRTQTQQVLKGLRSLIESTNLLLGALTKQKVLSAEQVIAVLNPFQKLASGALDDLLQTLKPTGNPISTKQLEAIRETLESIKKVVADKDLKLPMKDVLDLYYLIRKARDEHPDNPVFQEIVELAVFFVGVGGAPEINKVDLWSPQLVDPKEKPSIGGGQGASFRSKAHHFQGGLPFSSLPSGHSAVSVRYPITLNGQVTPRNSDMRNDHHRI